jgi:hypothetical protein
MTVVVLEVIFVGMRVMFGLPRVKLLLGNARI